MTGSPIIFLLNKKVAMRIFNNKNAQFSLMFNYIWTLYKYHRKSSMWFKKLMFLIIINDTNEY